MSILGYVACLLFMAYIVRLVDYYAQKRNIFYGKLEQKGIPKGLAKWGATKVKERN